MLDNGPSVRAELNCALGAHSVNKLEPDTQNLITFVEDITRVVVQLTLCLDQHVAQLRFAR